MAIITGASSGIGLSFAKILAETGTNLVLVSRKKEILMSIKDELEIKYHIKVNVFACDLSKPENINYLINILDDNSIYPDLLINNAGAGVHGNFSFTDLTKEIEIINLNTIAVTMLSKLIICRLNEKNKLNIINVSSTLAFRKSSGWAVYAATKSFVLSLSKSLEFEYRGTKINVSILCPGKTHTNFDSAAGVSYQNESGKNSPDFVAKYALKKLFKGKHIIIPGILNKMKYIFFKLMPEFVSDLIIKTR